LITPLQVSRPNNRMKTIFRFVFVVATVFALVMPVLADRASLLYTQGQDAEVRQDYEAAYSFYLEAWQLKPRNLAYRTAAARMRFQAGASHVKKGQQLRDQGKLQEALAEFEKAAAIDPASFIAQQEIRRTQTMIEAAKSAGAGESAVKPESFQRRLEGSAGTVELQPISNIPIQLKLTEDSKFVYESIGKLAGINVLFDPDYTSRRIHIELNGVSLPEALELVALESKTFWRPVTPNTIFVAADTPAKRKELEQNLVKTFYLSNLSQPTELQDVQNTLRTILEVSRLTAVPSQGAIVVRGTPDQVALAEKLINDLDKARPEVIVEVAVMQVTRERIRDLGINPPTSATVALANNVTVTPNNANNPNGTANTGTNTGNVTVTPTINLNTLGNLTAKNFVVTIPAASVNFLYSDSNSKLIQNPQIRALDGAKASLKIGERVPVATGSFGAGVGGLGVANTLVNTQFQYLDVGVNIDITPRVHMGREVTLKLSMDISAVDSHVNIGGIDQPVIGQRKIEHDIRLKEGEASLLGGILEDADSKTLSGYPWLSSIPILKYLFSEEHTDKRQNEIVFVLIPHIVRGQELSSLNLKPLSVGTANQIQLRQAPVAPAKPAVPPGSGTPSSTARPAQPGPAVPVPTAATTAPMSPGSAPAGTATAAGQPPAVQVQPVMLTFNPGSINTTVGQTFMLDVVVSGAQNLFSAPVQIQYDPTKLQLVNASNGGFLSQGEQAVALTQRDDTAIGQMVLTASRPPNSGGVSGQGPVFTLTFMAKDAGQATVAVTRAGLRDAANQSMAASGTQAVVNIKSSGH
jgi:general secretion pathway protein D